MFGLKNTLQETWTHPLARQVMLIIGTFFNVAGEVSTQGLTAILMKQVRETQRGFEINQTIISWLGSSVSGGILIGVLIVPFILDRLGRKTCHLLTIIPVIIGWPMIIFTENIYIIIAARIIQGISSGIRIPVCSIIIGECTSPIYRGLFLATINVSISVGLFYPHLIGTFYDYKITSAACLLLNIISLFIILALPDSPTGLAKAGKLKEANIAFQWFRGSSKKDQIEFEYMIENLDKDKKKQVGFKSAIKSLEFWKPFGIVVVAGIGYLGSGVYVISNYTLDLLESIIGADISPYIIMLGIDLLRVLVTIFGCFIAKVLKRRLLVHLSISITVLALFILSAYIYLKRGYNLDMDSIAIVAFLLYIYGLGSGLQALTYILTGEVFPVKYKSIAATLATFVNALTGFLILYLAPYMFASLGKDGTFLVYASLVSICWLVLYFTLPETKNRTLTDIENTITSNNKNTSVRTKL